MRSAGLRGFTRAKGLSRSAHDLALDALDMGLWTRWRAGRDVRGLVHASCTGVWRAILGGGPEVRVDAEGDRRRRVTQCPLDGQHVASGGYDPAGE